MKTFFARRFTYSIVLLLATTIFVFVMSRQTGDPRHLFLSEQSTQAEWDAWGVELGLDKPTWQQYVIWLGNAVTGDFGESIRQRRPSLDVVAERIPATLELAFGSFLFAIATGVPLGVLSALQRGSILDYIGRTFALIGQAAPVFWLGIVLVLIFSVNLGWLPVARRGGLEHYILPSITLGWLFASSFLRLTRSAMLEVLDSEFIKFARAKGVNNNVVIWKHAFRNALLPSLTYAGLLLAGLITGAVITETIFSWPGLGSLAVTSVLQLDFPVLTAIVCVITLAYAGMALLIDLLYAVADPRIRLE
jgi:ABC-type dipeptide/oligopeptide/nickel transport system permease component